MNGSRITSRYAKSLLDLAIERNELQQAYEGMQQVLDTCNENRDLRLLLQSPVVSADKKEQILNDVFGGLAPIVLQFVQIVVRKKREPLLLEIATELVRMYKAYSNIQTYYVTTATPLDDDLRAKVNETIKVWGVGGTAELVEQVDPNILGGFIIKLGDRLYDASLSSRFTELRTEFSKNPYVVDY